MPAAARAPPAVRDHYTKTDDGKLRLGRRGSGALAAQLKSKLSPETVGELSSVRGRLPTWMAERLSAMLARG